MFFTSLVNAQTTVPISSFPIPSGNDISGAQFLGNRNGNTYRFTLDQVLYKTLKVADTTIIFAPFVRRPELADSIRILRELIVAIDTGGGGGPINWESIIGKPSVFTPTAHSHAISDVVDLTAALEVLNAAAVPVPTTLGYVLKSSGTTPGAYYWAPESGVGTESDPTVPGDVKLITSTNISNWNAAYGWGNHASAGYATVTRLADTAGAIRSALNDFTVVNGATDGGQSVQAYAVDAHSIGIKTIGVNGTNGIEATVTEGADNNIINIDGSAFARFLSGTYAQRPVGPVLGQLYYQTDEVEGQYMYDGASWQYQPDGNTEVFCKFMSNTYPMNGNTNGTGAAHYQDGTYFSRWTLSTGSTNTGLAQLRTSQNFLSTIPASGKIIFHYKGVRLSSLSNGTDTYTARVGAPSGADALGLQVKYTNADSSGQWYCLSRNGTSSTAVASGVTVAAATDYDITIVYELYGTDNAKFYINGTLVATITTNLPAGFTNAYQGSLSITKTAGTESRTMLVDDQIIKFIP